jgi:Predicted membrane protein (DUF2306)
MPREFASLIDRKSGWAPGVLWALAIVTAAPIWWLVALPVLESGAVAHGNHALEVTLHAAGGTLMLAAGALALYVGWTRRGFGAHRWIGYTYLIGGGAGAAMGLALSIMSPHKPDGLAAATGTLAAVWLAVAAMAWRAARNRRFEAHRDWVIRSYVLTWTFVFCRMVMRLPALADASGDTIVATIWATWITPFVLCEIALNWKRTGPMQRE